MGPQVQRVLGRRGAEWLTVSAVVCALCGAVLLGACGGAQQGASPSPTTPATTPASPSSSLTAAEQEWLAQKDTLQVGAFSDYPPCGFVDKSGKAVGIAADFYIKELKVAAKVKPAGIYEKWMGQ